MKRLISGTGALLLVVLLAACTSGSGNLGTLPPASGSPEPSLPLGSPDVTPGATPSAPATGEPGSTPGTATPTPGAPTRPPSTDPPATQPPVGTTIVRAYFYLDGEQGGSGLVPVLREVPKTQAVARAALEALLDGPEASFPEGSPVMSTAIPDGTRLLGVSIANGVATVDLSGEFESGGGSASTMVRLAQVTYTLTQFPTVQRVLFRVDGETVTVFGSEGLVLSGPVGRKDYYDQLPSIFVDRPAWGAALGNPGRVSGLANVFEAQFRIALLDRSGRTLVDESVMASCGTGCWGTFDVQLRYDVGQSQWGTLRVYDPSEQDGSPESVREYPVWLTPG